jgi:putative ubiquitin-RnfH superfamily antitoxin RatB of RatAB toxin-antitoxin module
MKLTINKRRKVGAVERVEVVRRLLHDPVASEQRVVEIQATL